MGHVLLTPCIAVLDLWHKSTSQLRTACCHTTLASLHLQTPCDDHSLLELYRYIAISLSLYRHMTQVARRRRRATAADAAKAEKRFSKRLSTYRSGHRAPPAKWLLPGSCLAEMHRLRALN
jgi:hypothetical protein